MSHFSVLVITPHGTETEAEALLTPYSEHIEVEAYDKPCWCIGTTAKKSVRQLLEQEMPVEPARKNFSLRDDVCKFVEESKKAGNYGFSEEVDKLWEDEFEKPYTTREQELLAQHPDLNVADPTCNDCHGIGIETTTYNSKTKWNWYRLGGRWADTFAPFQGALVSFECGHTFAIITPDGQWHEKGTMLSFAVVIDEKDSKEWEVYYTEILEKHKGHRMLFYDCNI